MASIAHAGINIGWDNGGLLYSGLLLGLAGGVAGDLSGELCLSGDLVGGL